MKDPSLRLATGGQAQSVRQQPFFRGTDWRALKEMKVTPPYKPHIVNVSNTDCAFISGHKQLPLALHVKW